MNKAPSIEKTGAIIGISMLNPYFTRENIQATAEKIREQFGQIVFALPDKPANYTLYGYGYSPEEAQKTTSRKFKTLERNCRESIEALSLPNARILRWEEVEKREEYQRATRELDVLRATDATFRADVEESTRLVYENSQFPMKRPMLLEEQIEVGTPFLMHEVAFMLSSAKVVGVEKATHIYHRDIPVLSALLRGKYKIDPPKDLDFKILSNYQE